DDDSGGDHAKAGMRGILQMVTERRRRIFRSRLAVNVSHRPQRRLTNRATVKFPRNSLAERPGVKQREFAENVVRVLMIDKSLSVVGLSRLKDERKSWMRRSQRFC